MYQTVNLYAFRRAFETQRPNNFSYEGQEVLFNYLEQLEEDIGEGIELDVIALCCDYTESTIEEALSNYNLDSLDELRDNTLVLEVDDNTIIYQNY